MADVIQDAQQEFWRSPALNEPVAEASPPVDPPAPEACVDCGSEYMIAAQFCHTCGLRRALPAGASLNAVTTSRRARSTAWLGAQASSIAAAWRNLSFPNWLHYLHFHEIKRWVGLPTAALIAFMIGLGCVAGALGVSLFYKASNLAEFQAIQTWRIEWLLAATASFVAGILLKTPKSD